MDISNISDLDLNDPENLRTCFECWYLIDELSDKYLKLRDLRMELIERWNKANLTHEEQRAFLERVIEDQTQSKTGESMNTGTSWIKKMVQDSLEKMASVDAPYPDNVYYLKGSNV